MSNSNQELVELYNQGLSVTEISEETGYDIAAIKAVLLQCCHKFREDCHLASGASANSNSSSDERSNSDLLITKEEDREIVQALKRVAFEADNELVRFRALTYLHDEHKGRNDKDDTSRGLNMNILVFNRALRESKGDHQPKENSIIDV